MIKYFINRKTDKEITGIVTKDEKNIFIDGIKIGAVDYIIIECDTCGIEQKAVFKRRERYFEDKILCTKCHKKRTNLKKYGAEWPTQSKEVRKKTEKTCLERYGNKYGISFGSEKLNVIIKEKYGVDNVNKLPEIREKIKQTNIERYGGTGRGSCIIRKKIENTKLEKYGDKNFTNREKNSITIKERYGIDNISQLTETQETIKKNNLKKYGVENTTQLKTVQNKMKETNLERYGVENPCQHPEIIKLRQETFVKNHNVTSIAQLKKSKQTMINRYGASIKNSCKWFEVNGKKVQGNFELKIAKLLNENSIEFITHDEIEPINYITDKERKYYPDFYLPEYDLYLEPHAEYYWNEEFELKMSKVENKIKILYFDEKYEFNSVLDRIKE